MAFEINELATMDATAQAELVAPAGNHPARAGGCGYRSNRARESNSQRRDHATLRRCASGSRVAGVARWTFSWRAVSSQGHSARCRRGQPYYLGNRALRDAGFRSPVDTSLGARFRAAGFITLGKTNLPEFGEQTTTQPLAFGATHNSWDLDRSTNGSSGGSAAAVAAGMVPIAHADDGGGSIRLPAAWCGLVGLKPSAAGCRTRRTSAR